MNNLTERDKENKAAGITWKEISCPGLPASRVYYHDGLICVNEKAARVSAGLETYETNKSFVAGKEYSAASACDHNAIFSYKVISRRLTTLKIKSGDTEKRCKIYIDSEGVEYILPEGRYSMAPVVRANR